MRAGEGAVREQAGRAVCGEGRVVAGTGVVARAADNRHAARSACELKNS